MSYTDEFRAFARRHGVSDDAITRIMWNVQPSVHLEMRSPSEVGPEDHVVGYVGGLPEMPADAPWEEEYCFVAALDLAAVPKQPLDDGLPREGHLLLFAREDYHGCDGEPAPVIHVPPGTETSVRPAPVDRSPWEPHEEWTQEVLERQVLVCRPGTSWDVMGWTWDPEEVDDDRKERLGPLLAAIEEYAERVGTVPFVRRSCGLRGVALNPHHWYDHGAEFLRKGEEAVAVLRDEPERFDELYAAALEEVPGGLWLNLLEFGESSVFDQGDGEVGWVINRDDLLARRFDRVKQSYFC